MAEGVSPEQYAASITALRYVIWDQDHAEWLAAGGDAADAPPCPVRDADLSGLVVPLAALVIAVRRAMAEQLGITDPAEQGRFARGQLERELEALELNASFAAIDGEPGGGGQPPADG